MASPTLFIVAERLTATPLTRALNAGGCDAFNARAGAAALALGRSDLTGPDVALCLRDLCHQGISMQTKATAGMDRGGTASVSATY